MNSYAEIRQWRHDEMINHTTSHVSLNLFHDEIVERTVQSAMKKVQNELGHPPSPFAFFVMGSAGRSEQLVWSDQDHGIIFQGDSNQQPYFLALGKEITNGLEEVGYERCEGNVMASNPLWCQSIEDWNKQISAWLQEASWESLRHFSTFMDSRVLIGGEHLLSDLKQEAFSIIKRTPRITVRLAENFEFIKKGVGTFGQLLQEPYGQHAGMIDVKQTTMFPYVNALRLLALIYQIEAPSTLGRFHALPDKCESIKCLEQDFQALLAFRLKNRLRAESYQEVHFIPIDSLSKQDKQDLKRWIKQGNKLFQEAKKIMEKECSTW